MLAVGVAACARPREHEPDPEPQPVFPRGDAEQGRQTFIDLGCNSCHRVFGGDTPDPSASPEVPVTLGGGHARSRTHAQLMTAIVNPSHQIAPGYKDELVKSGSRSRMGDYSHVMTVRQLVDLLEYLESVHGWATYGDESSPHDR
jgi:sulfur-oxidizing protein SoxX